jgi:lipoic acid synthetase
MIMGKQCTRHCPFCNVQHGIPDKPDESEPERLAEAVVLLRLAHVVITSVTRDDLPDGGAEHYARCIRQIRAQSPKTGVEVLTPDFRHCAPDAIRILGSALPDVMNHNVETVPRLYPAVRPQASYTHTLSFLRQFRETYPAVPTKSGLMVGLGERDEEIIAVMRDLHANGVSMLTIGQYLSPSPHHLPVARYVPPETFSLLERIAHDIGFSRVTAGPLVRSSYHADTQACRSDEEETGTKAPHPSATTLSP